MVGAYAEVTNDNRDLDLVTRRSAWKANTAYYSGTGIDDMLDLVTSNGAWYRCIVTHRSSDSFTADFEAKKWKVFSWMENLATDILLSRKITADEIDVAKLVAKIIKTATAGPRIEIEGTQLKAFGDFVNPNIVIGVKDGYSVLSFFSNA